MIKLFYLNINRKRKIVIMKFKNEQAFIYKIDQIVFFESFEQIINYLNSTKNRWSGWHTNTPFSNKIQSLMPTGILTKTVKQKIDNNKNINIEYFCSFEKINDIMKIKETHPELFL